MILIIRLLSVEHSRRLLYLECGCCPRTQHAGPKTRCLSQETTLFDPRRTPSPMQRPGPSTGAAFPQNVPQLSRYLIQFPTSCVAPGGALASTTPIRSVHVQLDVNPPQLVDKVPPLMRLVRATSAIAPAAP